MTRLFMRAMIIAAGVSIAACGPSEGELSAIRIAEAGEIAKIEVEKERQKDSLAAERRRQESKALEQEAIAAAQAAAKAYAATMAQSYDNRLRTAVNSMDVSTRWSLWDDATKVLRLTNAQNYSVDFNLKCYTRAGSSKTFAISIAPRDTYEVGFIEGWSPGFVSGESCEIKDSDQVLRSFSIR